MKLQVHMFFYDVSQMIPVFMTACLIIRKLLEFRIEDVPWIPYYT
jgi:hypothetical protein